MCWWAAGDKRQVVGEPLDQEATVAAEMVVRVTLTGRREEVEADLRFSSPVVSML